MRCYEERKEGRKKGGVEEWRKVIKKNKERRMEVSQRKKKEKNEMEKEE